MSDLISRKGVSAWLYNMGHEKLSEYVLNEKRFPSEDRLIGKWLKRQTIEDVDFAYCSKCGERIIHWRKSSLWSYCPNCGAKMEFEK